MLMAIVMLPSVMRAQETLTVADGTETNSNVPVHGLWCDDFVRSQTIYPESMLSTMVGGTIESMTFYFSTAPTPWSSTFAVKLGTTSAPSFQSATFDASSTEEVYTGTLDVSNNMMTITFNTPFIYMGGNLLLDIYSLTDGSYSSGYFYGINSTNASVQGHDANSVGGISPTSFSFIPKTTFSYTTVAVACPMTSAITVSDVDAESANIAWTAGGTETSWDIYLTTNATEVPDENTNPTDYASSTSYSFDNLTSSTQYYVYVRANCGGSDGVSRWRSAAFMTSQIPAQLPYSQDWEDDTENANWYMGGNGVNQWTTGEAVNNTADGLKAMYVSNDNGVSNSYSTGSASTSWAYRDIDFGTYSEYNISFDWKCQGESSSFDYLKVYVGAPATPAATASSSGATPQGATLLGTYVLNSAWQSASINLIASGLSGVQRLYFLWWNDASSGSNPPAAVDNIVVTGTNCGTPTALVVDGTTPNSFTFHFSPSDVTDNSWEAMIYSETDTMTATFSDSSYTFTGLTSDMMYWVKVRTICENDEYSSWTNTASARTECDVFTAPFVENFSSFNTNPSSCWKRYSGLASSIFDGTASLTSTTSGWAFSSSNVFPIGHPKANVYGENCKYWLVSPLIDLSQLTNPALGFSLALTDYGNTDPIENPTAQADDKFMVIISTDGGFTWSAANATVWSDDSTNADYGYSTISTTGSDIMLSLSDYANQTVKIAFYVESTVPGGDNDLHITDVKVDEYISCLRPLSVSVEDIAEDQITFSWVPGAEESSWDVLCVEYGTEINEATADWTNVQDTTYTFTNLQPNTSYTLYVRANCGMETSYSRSVNVHTECTVISNLPYEDGFDDAAGSSVMPYCWTRNTTYSGYPATSTINFNGSYSLYFYTYVYGTSGYSIAAAPALDENIDANTLQVSFMYRANNSSDNLMVGVMTDPNDANTFVPVQTIYPNTDNPSNWISEEVDLTSYTGTGKYIAFKTEAVASYMYGSASNYAYIDNVNIHNLPDCRRPSNVTLLSTTDEEATITWTPGSQETAWDVVCLPQGASVTDETVWETVYDTTNVFTGLSAETDYVVYVKANCGNETSTANILNFTTACSSVSIPWTENFEQASSSEMPDCWTTVTSNSQYVYATSHNSSMMLQTAGNTIVATPALGAPMESLQISFSLTREGSSSGTYEVGVMSNLLDPSTFESVQSFDPESGIQNTFNVSFADVQTTGSNRYIAFRQTSTATNWYYWLDNVVVSELPECAAPVLSVGNIGMDEVTLNWSDAHGTQTNWELVFGLAGLNPNDSVATLISNETSTTIYNLQPNTSYAAYIRTLCDGGEISDWSAPVTILTLNAEPAQVPYICNFSDTVENNAWVLANGNANNKWYIGQPTGETDTVMFISSNGTDESYSGSESSVWAYRDFNFGSAAEFNLDIVWKCEGESSYDYMKVYMGAPNTVTAGSTATPSGATLISSQYMNQQNAYTHLNVTFDGSYANTTKRLYFYWHNDGSVYHDPAAVIKSIEINASSCGRVSDITASNITTTSFDITFAPNDENDGVWEYAVVPTGAQVNDEDVNEIFDTTFSVTGLTPSSLYDVYVRTVCGDGGNSAWSMITAATECSTITIPFEEDFDSYGEGGEENYPLCWTRSNNYSSSYQYPYISGSYSTSGSGALYFYASGSAYNLAVLPPVDVTVNPINTLMLSFDMMSPYSGSHQLIIGVMTNPNDLTTFTPIDTVANTTTYLFENQEVMLNSYTGAGSYIALKFVNASYNSVYVDDLVLDLLPTCWKPTNLASTAVTSTSASLTWTANSNETDWEVVYGTPGFNPETEGTTETVTGTPAITLTGLNSNTTYDVYVRANCSATDHSSWSSRLTITTDCMVYGMPFTEEFVNSAMPACWQSYAGIFGSGTPAASTSGWNFSNSQVFGAGHAKVNIYGTSCYYWLVTPVIDLTTATSPLLSFKLALTSYNSASAPSSTSPDDKFIVAVSTDNGATWSNSNVTLWNDGDANADYSYSQISTTGEVVNINLTQYVGQQIKIAFYGESTVAGGDNDLHIDSVVVAENTMPVTCQAPTNVAASNIAQTSATITWTAGGDETAWNLQYKAAADANWSNSIAVSNTPSYALTGLTANTAYQVRVQAVCDASNVSDWANGTFTTLNQDEPTCPAPTNVAANNITKNSAVITWSQEPNTASSWTVQYKQSAASNWETATANAMTYTLSGLIDNTQYDVQVIANCDNGLTSVASETIHFTTLIDGVNDYVLESSISVYPNPTSGQFTISNEQFTINSVDVYDVYGKLISTTKVEDTHVTLDINTYADGVYFARILTDKGVVTKRIVKK